MEFPLFIGEVVDDDFLKKHSQHIMGLKRLNQTVLTFSEGMIFHDEKVNGFVVFFPYEVLGNKKGCLLREDLLNQNRFDLISSEINRRIYRNGDVFYDITFYENKVERIYMYVKYGGKLI